MKFERPGKTNRMMEKQMQVLMDELAIAEVNSEEYDNILKELDSLTKVQACKKQNTKISADTKAMVASNLIGIILVLCYEKTDIITTKAFGMINKGRI